LNSGLGGAIGLGSQHASNISGEPSVDQSANIGSQLIGGDDSGIMMMAVKMQMAAANQIHKN